MLLVSEVTATGLIIQHWLANTSVAVRITIVPVHMHVVHGPDSN